MKTSQFKTLAFFLFFSIICFYSSCTKSNIKQGTGLRFAVMSNTYGDSPYAEFSPKLQYSVESINEDNPVFLVHLGGLVCGGSKWMGISNSDIKKQYIKFLKIFSKLSPIFYSVKGESDLFNTSSIPYEKYTKRKSYYSFNYGDLHFIVLDSIGHGDGLISLDQKKWLINDLNKYSNSESIYVFIHSVLFMPEKYSSFEEYRFKDYEILHKYFKEYKIKAVFSGNLPFYFKYDIDGISYINTGCCGFNSNYIKKDCIQYYIVDIDQGYLYIKPRYVFLRKK